MTTKLGPFTREWFADCRALAARGELCHAKLAAQVIDELERVEALQTWRPIDTATPADGLFLALLPDGSITVARWNKQRFNVPPRRARQPTHWMPLPKVQP